MNNLLLTPSEAVIISEKLPIDNDTLDFMERLCSIFRGRNTELDNQTSSILCCFDIFQAGRIQGIREERRKKRYKNVN